MSPGLRQGINEEGERNLFPKITVDKWQAGRELCCPDFQSSSSLNTGLFKDMNMMWTLIWGRCRLEILVGNSQWLGFKLH